MEGEKTQTLPESAARATAFVDLELESMKQSLISLVEAAALASTQVI